MMDYLACMPQAHPSRKGTDTVVTGCRVLLDPLVVTYIVTVMAVTYVSLV